MKNQTKQALILIQKNWDIMFNKYFEEHGIGPRIQSIMNELKDDMLIRYLHLGKNRSNILVTVEYLARMLNGEIYSRLELCVMRLGHVRTCKCFKYDKYKPCGYRINKKLFRDLLGK